MHIDTLFSKSSVDESAKRQSFADDLFDKIDTDKSGYIELFSDRTADGVVTNKKAEIYRFFSDMIEKFNKVNHAANGEEQRKGELFAGDIQKFNNENGLTFKNFNAIASRKQKDMNDKLVVYSSIDANDLSNAFFNIFDPPYYDKDEIESANITTVSGKLVGTMRNKGVSREELVKNWGVSTLDSMINCFESQQRLIEALKAKKSVEAYSMDYQILLNELLLKLKSLKTLMPPAADIFEHPEIKPLFQKLITLDPKIRWSLIP